MLPDYPEIKRKLLINFQKHMRKETQQDPLFKIVQKKPIYEGSNLEINSTDGHSEKKEFQTISAEFRIKPEDLIEKGLDAYNSKFSEVVEKMRNEQSKILIEGFEETTNRTGNIVDCKSKPMAEWYLEALEVSISFDDFGNPNMPNLLVSSNDYERIKSDYSKLELDPNVKEKKREIIERKRRQWIDKENNRKLVD
jgi:hypothetical protein